LPQPGGHRAKDCTFRGGVEDFARKGRLESSTAILQRRKEPAVTDNIERNESQEDVEGHLDAVERSDQGGDVEGHLDAVERSSGQDDDVVGHLDAVE
jgi:hypothetical protein